MKSFYLFSSILPGAEASSPQQSYPAESILKRSQELNVDLIVMGAHEKGIMHTFLGSVAKSVLRRSRIPTMIVPLPEKEELKRQKELRLQLTKE
jgi:hypothetical protein